MTKNEAIAQAERFLILSMGNVSPETAFHYATVSTAYSAYAAVIEEEIKVKV